MQNLHFIEMDETGELFIIQGEHKRMVLDRIKTDEREDDYVSWEMAKKQLKRS